MKYLFGCICKLYAHVNNCETKLPFRLLFCSPPHLMVLHLLAPLLPDVVLTIYLKSQGMNFGGAKSGFLFLSTGSKITPSHGGTLSLNSCRGNEKVNCPSMLLCQPYVTPWKQVVETASVSQD